MAARKNLAHSELVRERIKTTKLLDRAQAWALGENDPQNQKPIEMSPHQVTMILGLLRKVVPDLQSIEHSGEVAQPVHQVSAEPLSEDEWQQTYGGPPHLNG